MGTWGHTCNILSGLPYIKNRPRYIVDNRVSAIKVRPLYLPVPNSRYRDVYLSIFWSDTKLLPPDISRGGQYSHTYSTMHHVMLLITNFKITSILTCNIKVILIVRFSCRISKCEWNLKCESNNHWTMHYVMLLITNFDITFIFTCKRVVVMCYWPTTKCVSVMGCGSQH